MKYKFESKESKAVFFVKNASPARRIPKPYNLKKIDYSEGKGLMVTGGKKVVPPEPMQYMSEIDYIPPEPMRDMNETNYSNVAMRVTEASKLQKLLFSESFQLDDW